jgi:hypothetical protein
MEKAHDPAADYADMVGELRANAQTRQAGVATEGVKISLLGDASYRARFATEAQARDALLARLNNVDGIFSSQVGVELQVVSVEIDGELAQGLSATTNSSTLLGDLGKLRQRSRGLSATGLTHLFTGRDLDGNNAGIAYTLALCSPRYSASLTMAHTSVVLDTLITAHEIGHVFGAPHDGTEQCASTPSDQHIMAPNLNSSVTTFSQCSLAQFKAVIDSYSCVKALPVPAPSPAPPDTPAPPPSGDGGVGVGGGGGGGSLYPTLLLLLLTLRAARPRHRARSAFKST